MLSYQDIVQKLDQNDGLLSPDRRHCLKYRASVIVLDSVLEKVFKIIFTLSKTSAEIIDTNTMLYNEMVCFQQKKPHFKK